MNSDPSVGMVHRMFTYATNFNAEYERLGVDRRVIVNTEVCCECVSHAFTPVLSFLVPHMQQTRCGLPL